MQITDEDFALTLEDQDGDRMIVVRLLDLTPIAIHDRKTGEYAVVELDEEGRLALAEYLSR